MRVADKSFDLANRYRVLVFDDESGEGYPLKFHDEVTDEEAIAVAESISAERTARLAELEALENELKTLDDGNDY